MEFSIFISKHWQQFIFRMALVLTFLIRLNETKNIPPYATFIDTSLVNIKNDTPRREVRLLIKKIEDRDEKAWDRIARQTNHRLVEKIRTRKKRQREVVYIPPTNRRLVRLQSQTGFFLEILPNGKVGGNINKTKYTLMELQVITANIKRIKGKLSGRYLAINRKSRVISKDEPDHETYFLEEVSENFNHLYSSIKYPKVDPDVSWYVGLKRINKGKSLQGRTKRASRTLPGQTATHFSIFNESKR